MGAIVGGVLGKRAAGKAADAATAQSRLGIEELRRQFGIAREDLAPFREAGAGALGDVEQAASIPGFGERLAEIFSGGSLDPLIAERTRAAQGQLSAAGLNRSGTAVEEIADIPTDLGLQIEQLLTGRSQGLANLGFGAAQSGAGLASQLGQSLLGARQQIGQDRASGILGGAEAAAAFGQGALNLLGLALSDPRLKDNAVKVGEINDLGIYQWDWKPELEGMMVYETPTLGFMADEVEEKYPEYVSEFGGFKCIAYGPLTALLEYNAEEYHRQAAA